MTGQYDFQLRSGTLRILYEYTQNTTNRTSTVKITGAKFLFSGIFVGFYSSNFIAEGTITLIGNTQSSVNWYGLDAISDGCEVTTRNVFYDLGQEKTSGNVTVTHNSSGAGSFQLSVSKYQWGYNDKFTIVCEMEESDTQTIDATTVTVPLPNIGAPTVTISDLYANKAPSGSLYLRASSNSTADAWYYKFDNATRWELFSLTSGTVVAISLFQSDLPQTPGEHTVYVRMHSPTTDQFYESSGVTFEMPAPTLSVATSEITANSVKITVTSNAQCNDWEYRIGSGAYVVFSNIPQTSASVTITGLNPGETYSITVIAKKPSISPYGETTVSVKTVGISSLYRVDDFAIDAATPQLIYYVTTYALFHHIVKIKSTSGTELYSATYSNSGVGSWKITNNLSASARSTILNMMPSVKTMQVDVFLETYSDQEHTTLIGTSGPKRITLTTSAEVSAPTLPAFTYEDSNSAVTAVTHNNQVLLQNYSELLVHLVAATAKNGASIAGYSLTIGDTSISTTSLNVDMGIIETPGVLTLTVTVSDSRGYAATRTTSITVMEYYDPQFSSLTVRRRNEIEALTEVSFSGSVSPVQPSGTELNRIAVIRVRWKKTSDETWGSFTNLLPTTTVTGLFFSYEKLDYAELDASTSYDFEFYLEDAFGAMSALDTIVVLTQGTPLIALRKRTALYPMPRVGINNPAPTEALDVTGNIKMNGAIVMGFVKELGDDYLTGLSAGGYYLQLNSSKVQTANGYPVSGKIGLLEVIAGSSGAAVQRYTPFDLSAVYVRSCNGGIWGQWRTVAVS